MTFAEIKQLITDKFGVSVILAENASLQQPQLTIATAEISKVCAELYGNERTYFDFLSCLTALDNGPQAGTLEVIYNLYSIPFNHHITLKVELPRGTAGALPSVPTVSDVYKTALWHEREAFDFFGIIFERHPDLRRIFLPVDWEGYPLRKDYKQQDYYRGIKVEY